MKDTPQKLQKDFGSRIMLEPINISSSRPRYDVMGGNDTNQQQRSTVPGNGKRSVLSTFLSLQLGALGLRGAKIDGEDSNQQQFISTVKRLADLLREEGFKGDNDFAVVLNAVTAKKSIGDTSTAFADAVESLRYQNPDDINILDDLAEVAKKLQRRVVVEPATTSYRVKEGEKEQVISTVKRLADLLREKGVEGDDDFSVVFFKAFAAKKSIQDDTSSAFDCAIQSLRDQDSINNSGIISGIVKVAERIHDSGALSSGIIHSVLSYSHGM